MNASLERIRSAVPQPTARSAQELEHAIRQWLRNYLGEVLGLDCSDLDDASPLERYGLDSSAAVALAEDLGEWLGRELDPSITYDYPSIGELAGALSRARDGGHVAP